MQLRRRTAGSMAQQDGYVLLEALVAVLVAAVGFIGAARLQTLGLTMNNSSQARQKATLLAYQIGDRIRANQAAVSSRLYDNPAPGDRTCLTAAAGCTPTQLVEADLREWSDEVAAQLPGGQGKVCRDSTPDDGDAASPECDGLGNVFAIKLWWADKIDAPRADRIGAPRFVFTLRP